MFARVATFEGGDVDRLRQMNAAAMESGELDLPPGLKRALILQGDRRLFMTFFDTRNELEAAETRFEQMGDDIPEEIRGRRTSVDVYEVVFDSDL